jgi:hypothetical protein
MPKASANVLDDRPKFAQQCGRRSATKVDRADLDIAEQAVIMLDFIVKGLYVACCKLGIVERPVIGGCTSWRG